MKVIMVAVLACLNNNVMAEWTRVDGNEDGVTTYANLATIRRKGDIAKMWVLTDHKTVQKNELGGYLSNESQYEYNCREEQYRGLFVAIYSSNMGSGKPVHSSSSLTAWNPVRPGSMGELWFKIACGIRK